MHDLGWAAVNELVFAVDYLQWSFRRARHLYWRWRINRVGRRVVPIPFS